jgi:hypothetical protein
MPIVKAQEDKTPLTIAQQPKDITKDRIQLIMALYIAGWRNGDIAKHLGYTDARVSIIRSSPLYKSCKEVKKQELMSQVIDKTSDTIAGGNPIRRRLNEIAVKAVENYEHLINNKDPSIALRAVDSVIEKSDYRPPKESTKVSIEISSKVADRLQKALEYDESRCEGTARVSSIRIEKEMST